MAVSELAENNEACDEAPANELWHSRRRLENIVAWMTGAVMLLIGLGVVMVYSASAIRAEEFGWSFYFAERQLFWVAGGLIVMFISSRLDYRWYIRLRWPILLVGVGLLVAVMLPGMGTVVNGARRWFRIGGYSVQPSEMAKVIMVVVMAAFLARSGERLKNSFWRFCAISALAVIVAGLIAMEPDVGTALLIATVLGAMIFSAGARIWHIMVGMAAIGPAAAYYLATHFDHVHDRILAWLEGGSEGKAYHAYMSLLSLGSGGLDGMGLGQGWAKQWYLPEAHTDFIFAVIGQELGLLATGVVVLAFAVFVICGMKLVRLVPDPFAAHLATGLTLMIGLQAAFNMAVVTASVPTKGISLPFVSFGGSGMICSMAMIGILNSIARNASKYEEERSEKSCKNNPWTIHLARKILRRNLRDAA